MNPTRQLHDLGQSLWLDNITRGLLNSGTLARYIAEVSVTGRPSNPTIFDKAIKDSRFYDEAIHDKAAAGKSGEGLFFELALEDLTRAAALFRPGREFDTARAASQPVHQDSGHRGGHARHRGDDLRRRAGERHAAVLVRAVP